MTVSPEIAWALFLPAALALALTPGPDMIYVVSRALAQGRRAGLVSAAGLSLGLLAHTVGAAVGVSVLLAASQTAYTVLKIAGAAYLVWIGVQMWRAPARLDVHAATDRRSDRQLFLQGSLSALLNPKLALFFLAFIPQFVPAGSASPVADALALGAAFSIIGVLVQGAAGLLAGSLSSALRRSETRVRAVFRFSGGLMVLLGARLLLDSR